MHLNVPLRCSAPAGLPCAGSAEVTIRLWLAPSGMPQEPPQAGEAGWGLRGLAGAGSHGPCLAGFVPCVPWVRAAGGGGDAPGTMSLRRWSSCSGLQQGDIVCPPHHSALLFGGDCTLRGPRQGQVLASTVLAKGWESRELGLSAAASPEKLPERQIAACLAKAPSA